MGSLCGSSNTTNTSQTYTPAGSSQLQDIWNRVQSVASQPYTPYGGQLVAGLDPTQTAGVAGVNAAQGTATPYFNQAADYATQGASSIDPSQIQQYESPYTQSVINATQNQFNNSNAQQQQQVLGNAGKLGALGGDRVGVAQAELANQQNLAQAPVIAGLNNQNYTQALGAAQQDRAAKAQGAYTFGALAPAVQNTALQGATTQLGAGAVPQQNQQQQLSAQYQQYLQQLAFPYQQAQFLSSNGLPAVTAMGGTQAGQSTPPAPNPWGQIAGLGLSAAGLFLKDGGRVKGYASGGSPMGADNFIMVPSYIPQSAAPQSRAPQMTQMPQAQAQQPIQLPSAQALQSGIGGFKNLYDRMTWDGGTPLEGGAPIGGAGGGIGMAANGGRINGYANGGFVDTVHAIRRALSSGGAVSPSLIPQGYDDGGTVSFADRALPVEEAISSGSFDPQGDNYSPFTQPPPQARPTMATSLPPQITNPDNQPDSGMAFGYSPSTGGLVAQPTDGIEELSAQSKQPPSGGLFGTGFLSNLSPEAKSGLLSAGLGMMASKSPFALTQIGEGGQQGVQTYNQQKKETADRALQNQRVDLEAKRLAQSAAQFAQNHGFQEKQLGETQRYHDILDQQRKDSLDERRTRTGYVKNPDGTMTPIKGGPADPEQLAAVTKAKQTGSSLPDDTADFLAERILAGDSKALVGLGRGAQGGENIIKVQNLVARKAAAQGINPQDILEKVAEASGLNAQQRTFGTQTAKMAVNATEAQGAIELGRTASANVPRGNWVPINKVIQSYQAGTSDPALAKFGAANLAIVNTYARAINPTGVPHAADKEHAMALLSTATGPEAYNALLDQLNAEINIAHSAAPKAKKELEDIRKGKTGTEPISAPAPYRVKQNGHTYERQSDGSMKAID